MTLEVLAFVGPLTILSALLYYFGYVSAKAYFAYFGVSLGVLDLDPASYLVRSPGTFFRPAALLLGLAIALIFVNQLLGSVLRRLGVTRGRRAVWALGAVSIAIAAVGLVGLYDRPLGVAAPLWLAAAILLFEYAMSMAPRYRALPAVLLQGSPAPRRGLLAALGLVVAFWAVTLVADESGRANARLVEQNLLRLPQAVVYSEKDLHLPGPRVKGAPLAGQNSAYAIRYNGLRPLVYANARWFLLPAGWRHDNGSTVIVLQDDPGHVRVDLAP